MFGQPMKVCLETSNLPDEIVTSLKTEEDLADVVNATEIGGPVEGNADDVKQRLDRRNSRLTDNRTLSILRGVQKH